jgi:Zn-dependent M16 (insulinase) family peptidase
MRHQFKSRLLTLTRKDVKKAAETYFDENSQDHTVAVISGEEKLKKANAQLGGNPLELHRI